MDVMTRLRRMFEFSMPSALSTAGVPTRVLEQGEVAARGLSSRPAPPSSRIARYDQQGNRRSWILCQQAGWYHCSRARRAIDRQDWLAAERHSRSALAWDDTRSDNFLVLGETLLRRPAPDLLGARRALERALAISTRDSYVIKTLQEVYQALGWVDAEAELLRRALRAGAPIEVWGPELVKLDRRRNSRSPVPLSLLHLSRAFPTGGAARAPTPACDAPGELRAFQLRRCRETRRIALFAKVGERTSDASPVAPECGR
jgi:hypothetical protein